jgi:hypothetical protein
MFHTSNFERREYGRRVRKPIFNPYSNWGRDTSVRDLSRRVRCGRPGRSRSSWDRFWKNQQCLFDSPQGTWRVACWERQREWNAVESVGPFFGLFAPFGQPVIELCSRILGQVDESQASTARVIHPRNLHFRFQGGAGPR